MKHFLIIIASIGLLVFSYHCGYVDGRANGINDCIRWVQEALDDCGCIVIGGKTYQVKD